MSISPDLKVSPSSMEDKEQMPGDLLQCALWVLQTADADLKADRTHRVGEAWRSGHLPVGSMRSERPSTARPPRASDLTFISPGKAPKLGKPGSERYRIGILHALANVEQWAIDTAWDNIVRFSHYNPSPTKPFPACPVIQEGSRDVEGEDQEPVDPSIEYAEMPRDYFEDMVRMACEEAKHYGWFRDRLRELGSYYGSLPVHGSIWESVQETAHTLRCRLVIVHMVQEARGLDVNPQTIANFSRVGDLDTSRMLEKVHADEITHVSTGARWYRWECDRLGLDKTEEFAGSVRKHFHGALKSPFNTQDRLAAGMEEAWYAPLGVVRNREMGQAKHLSGK